VNRRDFLAAAAALPFAPAVAARRLGGTPVAFVTADLESRIAVVSLSSGHVLRSIPTLPGPRSVESWLGRLAIVAHTEHGAVSVVDAATLRVRHVVRGFAEPRYTASAPPYAYVTDSKRQEVVTLQPEVGRIVHRTALPGPARHVSVDAASRSLWVSLGSKAERIAILALDDDGARPRLVRTIRPPFLAHDVGFSPDGARIWITSGDRRELAVYGVRSGRLLFRLAADAPPQHVTFLGYFAYVTSGGDGTLRVHALDDGRLVRTTSVPAGSFNVQDGFGRVLTPSLERGTLCVLDASGRLVREVRVARSSHDACFVMSR
jgi:hypothetical protein